MFTPIKMLVLVISHSPICMETGGEKFTAHPSVLVVRVSNWCLNRVTTIADGLHVKLWGTKVKDTPSYAKSMEQKSSLKRSNHWWVKAQNSGWDLRPLCSLRLEQIPSHCRWITHEALKHRSVRHSIICAAMGAGWGTGYVAEIVRWEYCFIQARGLHWSHFYLANLFYSSLGSLRKSFSVVARYMMEKDQSRAALELADFLALLEVLYHFDQFNTPLWL